MLSLHHITSLTPEGQSQIDTITPGPDLPPASIVVHPAVSNRGQTFIHFKITGWERIISE